MHACMHAPGPRMRYEVGSDTCTFSWISIDFWVGFLISAVFLSLYIFISFQCTCQRRSSVDFFFQRFLNFWSCLRKGMGTLALNFGTENSLFFSSVCFLEFFFYNPTHTRNSCVSICSPMHMCPVACFLLSLPATVFVVTLKIASEKIAERFSCMTRERAGSGFWACSENG